MILHVPDWFARKVMLPTIEAEIGFLQAEVGRGFIPAEEAALKRTELEGLRQDILNSLNWTPDPDDDPLPM